MEGFITADGDDAATGYLATARYAPVTLPQAIMMCHYYHNRRVVSTYHMSRLKYSGILIGLGPQLFVDFDFA